MPFPPPLVAYHDTQILEKGIFFFVRLERSVKVLDPAGLASGTFQA